MDSSTYKFGPFIYLLCQLVALSLGGSFGARALALDYQIKPVPPNLVHDAQTLFLVDLSTPKNSADYAAGNTAIVVNAGGFRAGEGYRGTIGISSSGNIDARAWTIEMIARVPAAQASTATIPIGGWNCTTNCSLQLSLNLGVGVNARASSWKSGSSFNVSPYSGGNGANLQTNAIDRWVYLSLGIDFANQRSMVIAREMDGSLVGKSVQYFGNSGVDTSFLQSFPADQHSTELARRWQTTGDSFVMQMPTSFTLGNNAIDLRAVRISKGLRSEVLSNTADLPQANSTTWIPNVIDTTRTETNSVLRDVGYDGYNNFVKLPVPESLLRLQPGSAAATITLPNLPIGLYSLYVYGAVDAKNRNVLERVWRPTPMEFRALDASSRELAQGRMLLKQSFVPRRMQGFHFHVDSQGTVRVSLKVPSSAYETPLIQKIVLVDQLQGLPDVAIKKQQNLLPVGKAAQLNALTTARMARDDTIWNALPPLNLHLQVHGQVAEFRAPPTELTPEPWIIKSLDGIHSWNWPVHTFDPLDLLNKRTGQIFSQAQIYAGEPLPGVQADDGTGVFYPRESYPSLNASTSLYTSLRAELLGARYLLYLGALVDSQGSFGGAMLPKNYAANGDPNVGHDAALALVRWAYDWPALEMNLHEQRLSTHSPDFEYNTDWSLNRNGKLFYDGWSGTNTAGLLAAYDQVFPYIKDNQHFANAVQRFIPWVRTPQDVVRMLDRYLVFSSVRDARRGLIRGGNIEDLAATVLGPDPQTQSLLDLTKQYSEIYPLTGTYQELYATALSRSGSYYIASFEVYAFGAVQELIQKAYLLQQARIAGVSLPMDLSDIARYPKVRSAADFMLSMWVAGGFPFMIGDASGGPHAPADAQSRLRAASDALSKAFALTKDPKLAVILKDFIGSTDPIILTAAAGQLNPVLHAASRVIPDYGAVIEAGSSESDPLKKSAMTVRLGIGQGHSHSDYLDLNIFGMGLPLAVDLACRNEGDFWSRPGAGWSFLHNHALAHDPAVAGDPLDPRTSGVQSGEPWLRSFAPPLIQGSYVNDTGMIQIDRDAIMMEVGNSGSYYIFDNQRVKGGTYHTWAFHGAESDGLALNVPMTAESVRWTDRTLEGTRFTGVASDNLQATWTMTRAARDVPHQFNGGGVIRTVAAEQEVLSNLLGQNRYNPNLSPVNVRATLVGHAGEQVLQGSPYSQQYAFAFPFLWVQKLAQGVTNYPAVYEWYRGTTPVIKSVELLSNSPTVVRVSLNNGQIDTYASFDDGSFAAVSNDAQGTRWMKVVNAPSLEIGNARFQGSAARQAQITSIDYQQRTLTTSTDLPRDPYVIAGNAGRRIYLELRGSGRSFSWNDDLLIAEGAVTSLKLSSSDTLSITTNQGVLFAGSGNRKFEGMTVTNEDASWQFRAGKVIKQPVEGTLSPSVFTDTNGDGFVNAKTYEIGLGDTLTVPAETTLRRAAAGYEMQSNFGATVSISTGSYSLQAGSGWRTPSLVSAPRAPSALRLH